jgi:hypothetical protein
MGSEGDNERNKELYADPSEGMRDSQYFLTRASIPSETDQH